MSKPDNAFKGALAVVFLYVLTFLGVTGVLSVLFITLALQYPILVALYGIWLVYDWGTLSQGGRATRYCFLSRWGLFNIVKNYFPITLKRTDQLDPTKNYIFGYHPHGMIPDGAVVCFNTEAAGFKKLFPGIKPRVSMVSYINWLIGFREIIMAIGIISVSRDSLEYVLTKKGPGHSVVIMIGGSTEVLNTEPSMYHLVLNKRKGFARLALETGSSLVPVFAFGQNDLFYQPKSIFPPSIDSWLTKWPKVIAKYSLLVFHDLQTAGVKPRRTPIDVVVGSPIHVTQVAHATPEQIEELHAVYITKVVGLFEDHKTKYGLPRNCHLTFDTKDI